MKQKDLTFDINQPTEKKDFKESFSNQFNQSDNDQSILFEAVEIEETVGPKVTAPEDSSQKSSEKTLGQYLKQKRETLNLSSADVADRLYLPEAVIKQIEIDQYLDPKKQVFMRGYVRSYARLLEISDQEIQDLFELAGLTIERKMPEPLQFKTRQISFKDKKVRFITYGIILLLIILVLTWHALHRNSVVQTVEQPTVNIPNVTIIRNAEVP